jgi:hypothetical protein
MRWIKGSIWRISQRQSGTNFGKVRKPFALWVGNELHQTTIKVLIAPASDFNMLQSGLKFGVRVWRDLKH